MGNPWSTHGRPMDKSRATRELRTSKPWAPHGQPRTSHGGNTGTSRAAHEQPTDSLLWAIRGQPMGNNPRAAHGQPKGNPRVTHSQGTCKFGQPTDSCAWGYSCACAVWNEILQKKQAGPLCLVGATLESEDASSSPGKRLLFYFSLLFFT